MMALSGQMRFAIFKHQIYRIQEKRNQGKCSMNEEHVLVSQVYAAKEDMAAADRLISSYLPFIKSETAKYLKDQ